MNHSLNLPEEGYNQLSLDGILFNTRTDKKHSKIDVSVISRQELLITLYTQNIQTKYRQLL